MRYLLYYHRGFIKKFPLPGGPVVIGRGAGCDLVVDDGGLSRRHCQAEVYEDRLLVRDLSSRHGLWVDGVAVGEAAIRLQHSFVLGDTEFFFLRGDRREFEVNPELTGILASIPRRRRPESPESDTDDAGDRYHPLLQTLAARAFISADPEDLLWDCRRELARLVPQGSLMLCRNGRRKVLFDHQSLSAAEQEQVAEAAAPVGRRLEAGERHLDCIALVIHHPSPGWRLIYACPAGAWREGSRLNAFLVKLGQLMEMNARLATTDPLELYRPEYVFHEDGLALVGCSRAMRRLVATVRRVAVKQRHVVLLGETGTGKELVARMIHQLSGRRRYVAVNCSAIPAPLLESEMFGHEAGAFTDARRRKIGKLEEASGGTLVLDEIGEMSPEIQAKLLRAIQEKSVTRLGGNERIPVDLRIISITNQDLYQRVREKRFREDLLYRLRVHELTVPPLRERPEDIEPLVIFFTGRYARDGGLIPGGFSQTFRDRMLRYRWPGNVRELENEIARILDTIDDHELISDHHLLPRILEESRGPSQPVAAASLRGRMQGAERRELEELLRQSDGNKSKAARHLGMSYQGFLKKLKRLGIG
ncbi:MAG TPA: sigma 54-interacting transcriptional regulator [Acidobacteriota bacterium]|nr:sigma 54-interacting transcriptional regulator [Acidobacteriota bacterium]HQP73741.1 sigma 54-interacting transcriptional regulator [Acidobacteriota bacterium]